MMVGKHVTLRALDKADAETARRWRNSAEVSAYMASRDLICDAQQERWYAERVASGRDIYVMMVDTETGRDIGVMHLEAISHRNQNAVFGLYVALEEFRATPHSYEAAVLLFDWAFGYLNFVKITGTILASNARSRGWVKNLGFVEEGIQRQQAFLDGRFEDVVNVALFRATWAAEARSRALELLAARA